jgi:aminopeptidase N
MRRFLSTAAVLCLAITAITTAAAITTTAAAAAQAAEPPPVVRHRLEVVFDIAAHTAVVRDRVTLPAGIDTFELDRGLAIAYVPGATPDAASGSYAGENQRISYGGQGAFDIVTAATAHQPTDQVRFSRENVGGEITATVGPEGIWLSGDSAWLVTVEGALHAGTFTIDTPAGWFPVLSGTIIAQEEVGGRRRTTYEITEAVDGLPLVANTFVVSEREHGGITMRTCLLEEDQRLSELYLERTAHYLDLYGEMLGAYPYTSFTTVENWFPTGYGMPGWTLLGSQVLRLPFIPYVSFGHEIAHNWWGNSVFVDAEGGNWCEGLTVWCADYLYKLEESPEAARQYRRNQLKDYAAYVGGHPEKDFPLTDFKARHSGATRAVGYGKSMAVWHMLEQELGRDTVIEALRAVYHDFRGRPAAWSDFFAALESASGRDLSTFREQWLERTGAPTLVLDDVLREGDTVRFTLRQTEPPYALLVPVVARTPREELRDTVRLTTTEASFAITAPGATELLIDPGNDLFRHLDPTEIEPTLSQVFAVEEHVFVPPASGGLIKLATADFAREFCECEDPELREDGQPAPGKVNVLINPEPPLLESRRPAELRVHGDLVFLGGLRFDLGDHDLVFAVASPDGGSDLVVLTRNAGRLQGLGSRLGHYGKYSWLAFPAGGGQVERGNWQPAGSPLAATILP